MFTLSCRDFWVAVFCGVFFNLEHVASATEALHRKFLVAVVLTPENDDPANILLDVETQLKWLKQIGYKDVDCLWKWLEIARLTATKPQKQCSTKM